MNVILAIIAHFRRKRPVALLWQHAILFMGCAGLLVLARFTFAPSVPLFWPLLIWYFVFSFHFLLVRSLTANDAWADERADKIRRHAYDFQHVKDIYIKPTNFVEPKFPLEKRDE